MLSYCGTFNQDNDNQLDCSVGNTCIAEADCGDICFNRPNVNDCSPETRAIGGTCVEGPGSKAAKSTKSSKGGDKSKASKSSPTFVPTYVVRDYILYSILYATSSTNTHMHTAHPISKFFPLDVGKLFCL